MTDLSVIQSWPRAQLEDAFSQVEDQLAKALEAEKLARAGFDKAAAERDELRAELEKFMSGEKSDDEILEILKRIEKNVGETSRLSGTGVFIACLIALLMMNGCLKGCSL